MKPIAPAPWELKVRLAYFFLHHSLIFALATNDMTSVSNIIGQNNFLILANTNFPFYALSNQHIYEIIHYRAKSIHELVNHLLHFKLFSCKIRKSVGCTST